MCTAISMRLCLKDAPVPAISKILIQDVFCVFSMQTWSNPLHAELDKVLVEIIKVKVKG